MRQPFFSIIVPVYNGMPFVRDCLENLCNQTFADIEIILIDDGSTDKSDEVCEQYKNADYRITYIRNIHRGVSHARNFGLDYAKGKWIVFIDCDDLYSTETLMSAKHLIEQNPEVDLISGIFSRIDANNHHLSIFPHSKTGVFTFDEYVENGKYYPAGVCGHFLKNTIINNNNLRFNEDLTITEDGLFMVHYCAHVRNVILANELVYQYRINPNSAMRTKRTVSKIESQLSAARMMFDANDSDEKYFNRLKVARAHGTLSVTLLNVAESNYTIKELYAIFKSFNAKAKYMGFMTSRTIILHYFVKKIKEEIKYLLRIIRIRK